MSWLISQDVDVISNSVAWPNKGHGDGRGPINDDVRRAIESGAEWVVAAGNFAEQHWAGNYLDYEGDGWNNFNGGDQLNSIFIPAGHFLIVYLNWDDWFYSDQNYDLFVFDAFGFVVDASQNIQNGNQWPVERAIVLPTILDRVVHIAIRKTSAVGFRSARFNMFFRGVPPGAVEYNVRDQSITIPADTPGAISVAATHWATDQLESYSSWGPTMSGWPKPDISAPTVVSTASFGPQGFNGTSAAAPHVAGAIALMKSRFGIYTMDEISSILHARAIPLGPSNMFGVGRLDVIGQ